MKYDEYIAKYYGELFKPGYEKIKQIENLLSDLPGSTLLDLGCGSGEYIVMLEEVGYKVYGLDYSPEMVSQARAKMKEGKKEQVQVGDLKQPYPFEKDLIFDGIYCIGNTLPHLENLNQVNKALALAFERLNDRGKLLIQNINYDKSDILNKEFPVLNAKDGKVKFYREYLPAESGVDDEVIFKTVLEIFYDNGAKKLIEDSSELLMLKKEELESFLRETGFNKIEFYSDYLKNPWNKNEANTIVLAGKNI